MNYAEYYPQYKISKSCQISNDILEKVIESICISALDFIYQNDTFSCFSFIREESFGSMPKLTIIGKILFI